MTRKCLASLALVWLCSPATASAQDATKLPRVRTESDLVRSAVSHGLLASETFQKRHDSLHDTDGLIYIDEGDCGRSMRGCLRLTIHNSVHFRMLRIVVNPKLATGCVLTASIGHELQHAFEVLDDPLVRRTADLYFLFRRIGHNGDGPFETQAAVDVSAAIRREACDGFRWPAQEPFVSRGQKRPKFGA